MDALLAENAHTYRGAPPECFERLSRLRALEHQRTRRPVRSTSRSSSVVPKGTLALWTKARLARAAHRHRGDACRFPLRPSTILPESVGACCPRSGIVRDYADDHTFHRGEVYPGRFLRWDSSRAARLRHFIPEAAMVATGACRR